MKKLLIPLLFISFAASAQTVSQVYVIDTNSAIFKGNREIFTAMMSVTTKSMLVRRNDSLFVVTIGLVNDSVYSYRANFNDKIGTTKHTTDSTLLRGLIPTNTTQLTNGSSYITLASALTGYSSTTGTVAATDNVVQAINKLNGNTAATVTVANAALPKAGGTMTGKIVLAATQQPRRAIADVNATIAATDYLISFTSMTAARTVTLPTASTVSGQFFIIKDESGSASVVNIISIVGTVDNVANPSAITLGRGVYRIYSNGTNYFTW